MVDAAVGGKTGVNVAGVKNVVGSFHQPRMICADLDLLRTLPDDEYREGFAEIVKSGVIGDARLFRLLERDARALRDREPAMLEHVVTACIAFKARVVRADERESGRRAVLNFGHTVGHALEKVSSHGVRHGSSVAVGMGVEARLARAATGFSAVARRRLVGLLEALGLPTRLDAGHETDALLAAMRYDKKVRAGRVRFALPRALGRMPAGPDFTFEVAEDSVREAIDAAR